MATSASHPRYMPSMSLSVLHTLNIFSLSLLLPHQTLKMEEWIFVAIFLGLCALFNWRISTIINSIREMPKFSKLSDNVPGVREFPQVYGYLGLSFGLLILPALLI
jgi:preprotein translocase subunit SecY